MDGKMITTEEFMKCIKKSYIPFYYC